MTGYGATDGCAFDTPRLDVAEWHSAAERHGIDLGEAVATILTAHTTRSLPLAWRGDFSLDRARRWIAERDSESGTLLALERESWKPVGIVILFESRVEALAGTDLRIGYVLDREAWGRGLASELVAGLLDWSRSQPSIGSISGGVEADNAASARVMEKNGFERTSESPGGERIYRLEFYQA